MVDRIVMYNSDFQGKINWERLRRFYPSDAEYGFKYYRLKNAYKNKQGVQLSVKIKETKGVCHLGIMGSVRKWHFGINGFQDLRRFQFEKVIELIGKELCSDKNALWGFNVSQLEIGANVQLKMELKGIVDSYTSYSSFKKIWYEGKTSSFEGEGYTMSVYDKGEQIVAERKSRKSKLDSVPIEKLITRATWMRYELKATKLSKVPDLKKIANTPGKILTNWNEILELFYTKQKQIMFTPLTTPSYTKEFAGKNKTDLKNYLIHVGMESIGIPNAMSMAENLKRNKHEAKKDLKAVNDLYRDKSKDEALDKLRFAIGRRIRTLKDFRYAA